MYFEEHLERIFNNLSDENCLITKLKLLTYGFSEIFINGIFPNVETIDFDLYEEKTTTQKGTVSDMLKNKNFVEGFDNLSKQDFIEGIVCLVYCWIMGGKESCARNEIVNNISNAFSFNFKIKLGIDFLPNNLIEGLFDIIDSNKDGMINNYEDFITCEIKKSEVNNYITNNISTIINFISRFTSELNPDELEGELNSLVNEIYRTSGENNIIVPRDAILKNIERLENNNEYDNDNNFNSINESQERPQSLDEQQ